jgi:hypothetical protein
MPLLFKNITTNSTHALGANIGYDTRSKRIYYVDGVFDGASVSVKAKDAESGHGSAIEEHVFTDAASLIFEGQPQFGWDFVVSNAGASTDISIGWY